MPEVLLLSDDDFRPLREDPAYAGGPIDCVERAIRAHDQGKTRFQGIVDRNPGEFEGLRVALAAGTETYTGLRLFGNPPHTRAFMLFDGTTRSMLALMDYGVLNSLRVGAIAGVAAKYLAPKHVECIGIVGTGVQARLQLQYLRDIIECNNVIVWGRSSDALSDYKEAMTKHGYKIKTATDISDIIDYCQLIVTCTPSEEVLINRVNPGTHITAMGSDTIAKRELSSDVLLQANIVVTDSRSQSKERGEIYQASKDGFSVNGTTELGEIILGTAQSRTQQEQITIADLTGVAVQDIQISKAILKNL